MHATSLHNLERGTSGRMPLPLFGLLAANLDLLLAVAWWMPHGVAPIQIPQGIAAWVIGVDDARAGGAASAVFGMLFYASLVAMMALLYRHLARRWPALHAHPLASGAAFGIAMYLGLFKVALPLWGAAPMPPEPWAWTLVCVAAYVFIIGMPAALLARLHFERAVSAPSRYGR